MPAPVIPRVEPKDLLDPKKRPDDMPEPMDGEHARMMSSFLTQHPVQYPPWTCGTCGDDVRLNPSAPMVCPKGHKAKCSDCGDQQLFSPSGPFCKNGHGGADSRREGGEETPPPPEPAAPQAKTVSYQDLID
jgi:hypothetical protein